MVGRVELITVPALGYGCDEVFGGLVFVVEEDSDHLITVDTVLSALRTQHVLVRAYDVLFDALPSAGNKLEAFKGGLSC